MGNDSHLEDGEMDFDANQIPKKEKLIIKPKRRPEASSSRGSVFGWKILFCKYVEM